ncbi:amino acid permease 3-like [Mangifera indica]|uniref:amino acid permease 3-like n=1 Tax=Mangifera indica TaxID=29780 RepID=UPI001CFC2F0B|nr:amino acid permease 3-like [Mangifera indica]
MGDQTANQNQVSNDVGNRKPTGALWAATAHIVTALIGSGVLSLAWATAQLGWIFGPIVMLLFSLVTCYTFTLFADAISSEERAAYDTYMKIFESKLDRIKFKIGEVVYYISLFGVAIGYTTESSACLNAIQWSKWFHSGGDYHMNRILCVVIFGVIQMFFSQIYECKILRRITVFVTAVTSFAYSMIGLGLSVAKVAVTGKFMGSSTGISIGTVTETQKIWRTFHAVGVIAYAYSYFIILIEIHGSINSPTSERETLKKASRASVISVVLTTLIYMLCGCFGYAAFGDLSPENLVTGLGFDKPFLLLEIAKVAIVIHLIGAYQVYSQPLFKFIENEVSQQKLARLVWKTIFVAITSFMSMLLPSFNDGVGLIGALGFWPFTVYFPVEIYIKEKEKKKEIEKWSKKWIWLQILSFTCFIISIAAAIGSIAGFVLNLKTFKPFKFAN